MKLFARRLLVTLWEAAFQSGRRFTDWALVRRSRACGCAACMLIVALVEAQRKASAGAVGPVPAREWMH